MKSKSFPNLPKIASLTGPPTRANLNPATLNNLGALQFQEGKLEAAKISFKNALKLKPDYADAYSNMGIAFKDLGKLDNALEAYKKAISLRPNFSAIA